MSSPLSNRLSWTGRRLILAIAGLYALLQIITFLRVYSARKMDNEPIDFNDMTRDRLVAWSIGVLFAIIIVHTTRFLLQKNWPWLRIIVIHLLFALLISFVWYSTFLAVADLFCTGPNCNQAGQDFVYWYLINFDKLFLMYLFTSSVTYTYYYVQRDQEHHLQHSRMETQLLQARLKTLRSQLQPHFLFNTLNSIASLMDIDVGRAKIMVADLGELLRRVLDWGDIQLVRLQDELDLLGKYVEIEKTRFSDDLEVEWHIEPESLQAQVPTMVLQPLVENAIRHGFSRSHLDLRLRIEAFTSQGRLHLVVQDDGQGLQPSAVGVDIFTKGTGLQNTRERLSSIFGADFQFTVEDTHPGVRSEIVIPLNQAQRAPDQLKTATA